MYNKLFTKILDSSIWEESDHVRLVWITFLALMDFDGVVALSSVRNVARRANIPNDKAEEAITVLESPDTINPDQENEGRRIERIPGVGWFVLNAEKYRNFVKAEEVRAQTRARVAKHRAMKRKCNENVTLTETDTETDTETEEDKDTAKPATLTRSRDRLDPKIPCPTDFRPSEEMWQWAAKQCPHVNLDDELEDFVTYWRESATRNHMRTIRGWNATWKNRMKEQQKRGVTHGTKPERKTNVDKWQDTRAVIEKYPSEIDLARENASDVKRLE